MSDQAATSLANLPYDVIEHLATNYLDKQDLDECMCASSTWFSIFNPFRYQQVELFNRVKFKSFIQNLEQSMARKKRRKLRSTLLNIPHTINRGSHIQKLIVLDGVMTAKEMQRLGKLCPNTTSIRFCWQVSSGQTIVKRHTAARRWFYSPAGFLEHFQPNNVTCLELNGLGSGCDIPSDIFRHLPRLGSLTMSSTRFSISIAYLERLHELCPRLRYMKFMKPDISDDSVSLSDIERVKPASSMQNLCLRVKQVWETRDVLDSTWFRYIVRKYCHLRCLDIGTKRDIFERVLRPGRPTEDPPNTPVIALRDYFPRLEELSLGEFAGKPSTTWPVLVKDIRKITLCDDAMSLFPTWINDDATKGIVKLSLSALPNDLQGLGNCKHLRELHLDSGPFLQPDAPFGTPEIALDVVLSCCLALEKLSITGSIIRYNHPATETKKSPLKHLELINAVLTNEVLANVANHCPHIMYLYLRLCMWIDPSDYPVIRLDFSQHRLSYFRLVSPWTCKEAERDHMYATFFPDEFGRTRYIADRKPGINDCFMLKTSEDGKSKPLLFGTGSLTSYHKAKVTRLHDSGIMNWLEGDESQGQEEQVKAKQAIESLREVKENTQSYRYWSTVLSCRSVTLLYYNNGRLNLDDGDFYSTDQKYKCYIFHAL